MSAVRLYSNDGDRRSGLAPKAELRDNHAPMSKAKESNASFSEHVQVSCDVQLCAPPPDVGGLA